MKINDLINDDVQLMLSYDPVMLNAAYIAESLPFSKKRIAKIVNIRDVRTKNYMVVAECSDLHLTCHISGTSYARVTLSILLAVIKLVFPGVILRFSKCENDAI